jgi:hypothetical protein
MKPASKDKYIILYYISYEAAGTARYTGFMSTVMKREDVDHNVSKLLDAAKLEPVVIVDDDGRYILSFTPHEKRPVKDWIHSPPTLEDEDQL